MVDRQQIESAPKFPFRVLVGALLITVFLLLAMAWQAFRSYREFERSMVVLFELKTELHNLETSPNLTLLAREVVASEGSRMRLTYDSEAGALRRTIGKIAELSPTAGINRLALDLKQANGQLLAMQAEAKAMASRGKNQEARNLLYSDSYAQHLARFDAINAQLMAAIGAYSEQELAELRSRSLLILWLTAGVLTLLIAIWFHVMRLMRRHEQERSNLEMRLRSLSLRDHLTGLYNRYGFALLAEQELRKSRRSQQPMCLLFCDMDGLKAINDQYGHDAGDDALRAVARVLRRTFRDHDLIGRLGGDEFVVLASEADGAAAQSLLLRLDTEIARFNQEENEADWQISLSIGSVESDPSKPRTLRELLAEADAGMYREKRQRKSSGSNAEVGLLMETH